MGFSYWVKQVSHDNYSVGGGFYLLYSHFIKYKVGFGIDSNNSAELMALGCLLKLPRDKGIESL